MSVNWEPFTQPKGAGKVRPEHDFKLNFNDWELAVFDNAVSFHTLSIKGRGTRQRQEFGADMEAAMEHAEKDKRTCVYAVAESGRYITLDYAIWPRWRKRRIKNELARILQTRGGINA